MSECVALGAFRAHIPQFCFRRPSDLLSDVPSQDELDRASAKMFRWRAPPTGFNAVEFEPVAPDVGLILVSLRRSATRQRSLILPPVKARHYYVGP